MMATAETNWPPWWDWELEFTNHLFDRMIDRDFTEVELRSMMEMSLRIRESQEPGRWVVEASHESQPWEVIVEPDWTDKVLVVITAYPVESP